jgi:hypothetical protein
LLPPSRWPSHARSLAAQRQWILDRIEAKPDLTLRELVGLTLPLTFIQ